MVVPLWWGLRTSPILFLALFCFCRHVPHWICLPRRPQLSPGVFLFVLKALSSLSFFAALSVTHETTCFFKHHVVLQSLEGVTMDFQIRCHWNLRESSWEEDSRWNEPLRSRSPPLQTLSSPLIHTSSEGNTSSSLNRTSTMSLLSANFKRALYFLLSAVLNTP